jgi:tetratricopeptide (TPR) repeat protein
MSDCLTCKHYSYKHLTGVWPARRLFTSSPMATHDLRPASDRLSKLLAASSAFLAVNSAYLAAFATASLFYYSNVALHVIVGVVWAIAGAIWLRRRLRGLGPAERLAALLLVAGTALGVALTITGALTRYRWLLLAHITVVSAGAVLALAIVAARLGPQVRGRLRPAHAIAVVLLLAAAGWSTAMVLRQRGAALGAYRIVNPQAPPITMDGEGGGPESPFFPSSANTNVNGIIPANFFMTSKTCERCHKDIYDQWNSSMHHFSSFNNQWYRKSIEYMQDVVGTRPSKWCAGCHDHAVFFNGRFDKPIKEQIETPEAQAGLACTSCHSISHVGSTMGQGDFTIEYPPLHDLAASNNPLLAFAHDRLTFLDPAPHRDTFLKPFHREQTPEFCSSCHKVHLDVPVNGYRWFRGFNDYDNWQASGISGEGARSFYYPPKSMKCADCHMPLVPSTDPAAKNGMVKSHRFPGANTAIPFVNGDAVQLKTTQQFLQDGAVSVDIFGLVRGGEANATEKKVVSADQDLASTFAVGEESMNFGAQQAFIARPAEVIGPLGKVDAVVRAGDSIRLEVVVRTRKVGHFFPGGTVDAFDVWVELEAVDDRGRTIFHSGAVKDGGKGPVETGAHFYRSLQLDERGNVINKRNAWSTRSVAYVRLIPPGAADTIHYRMRIPDDASGTITLRAKVNYRKFAWWNTQWAYAGVRDPNVKGASTTASYDDHPFVFTGDTSKVSGNMKHIPDIPITTMAKAEVPLRVAAKDTPLPAAATFLDKSVRERWNDYGIGLLLQGDLKAAEAAFLKVTEMEPLYADGYVNVARARIQEGNMSGAEEMLRRALTIDPGLAKTHFFLGTALKSLGRYDEALEHLRTASSKYPRDRVVLNQLGRVLFLQRQYGPAVEALKRVLGVDPEDLQAHYNLMLAYRGLGQTELAAREEALYRRFKADEASQAITGPFRQLHPDDNNERQSIHEHVTVPVTTTKLTSNDSRSLPAKAGSHAETSVASGFSRKASSPVASGFSRPSTVLGTALSQSKGRKAATGGGQ